MATPATVDDYLATLPEDRRGVLAQVRETVRAAVPDGTEVIAYGMPGLRVAGRLLVSYAAFREHYSLFPASGVVRDALGDDLAPYLTGKGTIAFPADRPVPLALVDRVVRARLAEIAAGGR